MWITIHTIYLVYTIFASIMKTKNKGLSAKIIHLDKEVIRILTVKGASKTPILTAKEVIQNLAINYAKK